MTRSVIVKGPEDFASWFAVSRETLDRLLIYAAMLEEWGKTRDLVAPSTMPQVWHRHFADSAQLLPLLGDARRIVDLGSGAGFPGLLLAILLAPTPAAKRPSVALVESRQRKCAFLAAVAERCGVNVDIIAERIENPATHRSLLSVDIVTARALAPLGKLLGLAKPLFNADTRGLFLKGRNAASEIAAAHTHWQFEHRLIPSMTSPEAAIVEIEQLRAVKRGRP